jgi:P-type Cu+ transporter
MAAEHAARTIRMHIVGMGCDGCVSSVHEALQGISGVIRAEVDLHRASAEVEIAPSIEPAALIAAVEAAGYDATVA